MRYSTQRSSICKLNKEDAKATDRYPNRGQLGVLLDGIAATTGLIGCGTGNGFFGKAPQTYNVTITATSGTIEHLVNVTLNVQ